MAFSIGIIDEQPLVRLGVRSVVERLDSCRVVGEGSTGAEALALVHACDVLTVDLVLGPSSGPGLIEQLHLACPSTHIVVVSALDECVYAERCVQLGARGYVSKSAPPDALLTALDGVFDGRIHLGEQVLRQLASRVHVGSDTGDPLGELSDREFEVFLLLGLDHRPRAIGEMLGLSAKTVESYVDRIKRKLGLTSGDRLRRLARLWSSGARVNEELTGFR